MLPEYLLQCRARFSGCLNPLGSLKTHFVKGIPCLAHPKSLAASRCWAVRKPSTAPITRPKCLKPSTTSIPITIIRQIRLPRIHQPVSDYRPARFRHYRYPLHPRCEMVESKSLKLYLFSFRNHGDFHEDCVNVIMKDLIALMNPKYIEVHGIFTPRGGIAIHPFANYGRWHER